MLRAVRARRTGGSATVRQRFPEVGEQQPELVAQHYEAATNRAGVDYWTLAGDRAMGRGAYREAIQAFERALRLVERCRIRRAELRARARASSTRWDRAADHPGYAAPAVEEVFVRAQRLCERLGGDVSVRVLHGIWGVAIMRSDRERTARLLPASSASAQSTNPV